MIQDTISFLSQADPEVGASIQEEFTRERAVLLQQAQQIVEKYRQDLHKWERYRAQRVSGC